MSSNNSLLQSSFKSTASFQDTYKLIIIGDSTVGKTSFIKRLVKNEFILTTPTIGVAYENKLLKVPNIHNYTVKLQIWDTAGSEKYKSVTTAYIFDYNTIYRHYRKA
jgi:small GTP-binding protein